MAGGDHGNQRHEAAQRRDRVVELRDQGLTFRQIGAEMGFSHVRAIQLHKQAMKERPVLQASAERDAERKQRQLVVLDEQRREVEMEREAVLEVLHRDGRTVVTAAGKVIEGVQDDPQMLAAVDRLVRLDELLLKLADHEAKLLGLYSKTEVNVSGGVKYEVVGLPSEDLM